MQTVIEALKESGIDYTLILSNGFFGYLLPQLGQMGPLPVPETVSVYAGGNTQGRRIEKNAICMSMAVISLHLSLRLTMPLHLS